MAASSNSLRTLFFDIESAPYVSYTWGKYDQNVIAFKQDTYMLCFAYRWHGEKKTRVVSLPDFPQYKKDPTNDEALVKTLWALFDKADIIVAHNGDAFDVKYANSRFIKHGLVPPTHYRTVDTLKIARRKFKLASNKLTDIGDALKVGIKIDTGGFSLWLGCMAGDSKAWTKMKRYNRQDVDLLILIYDKLKAWMPNHPNLNVIAGTDRNCSVCHGTHVHKAGQMFTNAQKQQRWKCMDCGANLYSNLKGDKPLKSQ